MSKEKVGFLSQKERKINVRILTALIAVTIIVSIGSAVVIPKFTAENQYGMPIDISSGQGFFPCDDSIILKNASIIYQDPHDEITVYRWFIDGNPVSIGPSTTYTVANKDSFSAQLVVDNYTNVQNSSAVFSFSSSCGIISENFSTVPAYDDITYDPNGSITFYDQSYSKLDPEYDITSWWWKGVNLETHEEKKSSDNYLKMKLPNKTGVQYKIDLVVGDSSGRNFSSLTKTVIVPPDNVIPVANFTVVPAIGGCPLNVSVIDQSISMVNYTVSNVSLDYNYSVYNTINPSILIYNNVRDRNPIFNLSNPGTYSITLNVTNIYGVSNAKTMEIQVSGYPNLTLNASFSAAPQYGNPPLTVTFIDTSRKNEPVNYEWDFDDGSGPVNTPSGTHVFGSREYPYNVKLKITGTESKSTSDFILPVWVEELDAKFLTEDKGSRTYSFRDVSDGFPTQWYWDFGDGFSGRGNVVEHSYKVPGDYSVIMYAWNDLRKDSVIQKIGVL
ncbi:PKD domain protein [anaerobic digester metagenome]